MGLTVTEPNIRMRAVRADDFLFFACTHWYTNYCQRSVSIASA